MESLADTGKNPRIEIQGHADLTGTDKSNSQISQKRADKIYEEFMKSDKLRSISQFIKAIGIGVQKDSRCKVDIKVDISEK